MLYIDSIKHGLSIAEQRDIKISKVRLRSFISGLSEHIENEQKAVDILASLINEGEICNKATHKIYEICRLLGGDDYVYLLERIVK